MLRYNIHLRFIAQLYGLVHHTRVSRGRPLLKWHLKIMAQITKHQRGGKKEMDKQHNFCWKISVLQEVQICIYGL